MAKLIMEGKEIAYSVADRPISIGRSSQCEVSIEDGQSSRKHCEIGKEDNRYYVKDLNSYNGTYLNDKKIEFALLNSGDKIRIGKTSFSFLLEEPSTLAVSNPKMPLATQTSVFLFVKEPKCLPRKVFLSKGSNTVGRAESNDVCIKASQISSRHAEIVFKKNRWWICDLQSKNGVFVRGKKVSSSVLKNGDAIRFGEIRCVFKNLEEPRVASLPKTPMLFLAGVLFFILVASIQIARCSLSGVHEIPGNLIDDFSFEDVKERLSWECRGEMKILQKENLARSGNSILHFSSSDVDSNAHEAWYWETISPLPYGKVYRVSLWLKHKNLQGAAGLKLTWIGKEKTTQKDYKIGDFFSPLVTGEQEKWEQIEFIATPPLLATGMKVACFVSGKAESVCFDDICILEISASKEHEGPYLSQGGLKVQLDHRGILSIHRGPDMFVSSGKLILWSENENEKKEVATQHFAIGKTKFTPQEMEWTGGIWTAEAPSFIPVSVQCRLKEKEIHFSSEVKLPAHLSQVRGEYRLETPPILENLKFAGEGIFSDKTGKIPFPVNQVIFDLSELHKQMGCLYNPPVLLDVVLEKNRIIFSHRILPLEERGMFFEFTLKTRSPEDFSRIEKWQALAQECEAEKKFGEAMQHYQKILDHFKFHPAVEKIQSRMNILGALYEKEMAQGIEILNQARFFNLPSLYAQALQEYQEIQKRWQGAPDLARLQKIMDEARSENTKFRLAEIEKKSSLWYRRALDLEKENCPTLALLFYRQIVARYPESPSAKISLKKMNSLKSK